MPVSGIGRPEEATIASPAVTDYGPSTRSGLHAGNPRPFLRSSGEERFRSGNPVQIGFSPKLGAR